MQTGMNRAAVSMLGMTAFVVGGCARLPQASLVYASTQQMGVSVNAGTAETPGLKLVIGYNGLNAASVPVVVQLACAELSDTECSEFNRTIQPILGSSDNIYDQTGVEQQVAALSRRIENFDSEIRQSNLAVTGLDRQIEELSALSRRSGELTALDAVVDADAEAIRTREAIRQAPAQLAEANRQRDTRIRQKTEVEASRAAAQAEMTALRERRDTREATGRRDALSVYGSFNGNANGDNDSAGLAVGQVFSTGVASQHLTQGIQDSAVLRAARECLNGLVELADALPASDGRDAARTAILKSAGQVCAIPSVR